MKEVVLGWLESGAPLAEGVRLFSLHYGQSHPFLTILTANHIAAKPILIRQLGRHHAITIPDPAADLPDAPIRFRTEWPFLSHPDCPPELKILAAHKITAYHTYIHAHSRLFDATTAAQAEHTVKELVENYLENRSIIAEFMHYKKHNAILGDHPIFKQYQQILTLRQKHPLELQHLKTKLEHNIWRIQSEIDKNNKPHLKYQRQKSIQAKQTQLTEINRILHHYQTHT